MNIDFVERCVRYMMKVECKRCTEQVYPHEDDARGLVKDWIEYDDLQDIEGLKMRIDRICDYCDHMMSKDD